MRTPNEVKMALEMRAQELAVTIVGVHSLVLVDDGTVVDAHFDITPDPCGCGLSFQFELPSEVGRDELRSFAEWLAEPDRCSCETVH